MHFPDIVAAHLQPHHPMTATLGQQDTAYLRIGPWPILIATATKGQRVSLRIRGVKDRAIDGHKPIATKEGPGHAGGLGDQVTALLHEGLQTLAPQFLASSTAPRIAQPALRLTRMQIAEFAHQLLPHLALVQTAPQRHPDHKQHQRQGGTRPHPPRFG